MTINKLGDLNYEIPIHVDFYRGTIVLRQDGEYDKQEEIKLNSSQVDALFKAIKKHSKEAESLI